MAQLVVKDVLLQFGGVTALDRVSFQVERGNIHAIIGPNGAGKTSMLNCISGVNRPQRGSVTFEGIELKRLSPHLRTRLGLARTFQNIALFKGMTVLDNLLIGRHCHQNTGILRGGLYYGWGRREEIAQRKIVEEIIDFLEIQSIRKKVVGTLAYGLQKRVELGRALALEPKLLLLDEPMAGMNAEEKEDMARFILDINQDRGVTILMIEHDMGVVMDVSHHICVLNFGKLIADGLPEEGPVAGRFRATVSPMEFPEGQNTFPKLLVRNAEQLGDKVALREKEFGIWQSFTWTQYRDRVREFALGLVALGMQRGDKVAIIGDNRPEWVFAELSAQANGGAAVGLYQDSNLTEVAYVIDHCDATSVVAEEQEQVDKVLGMIGKLPKIKRVIYSDPRGLKSYRHPALLSFDQVSAQGRAFAEANPHHWVESVRRGRAEDLALIAYTSGTTGFPKGAMLSFQNLLTMALSLNQVDRKLEKDEFVSFLPLAWIGEQMMSVATALAIGFTVNFPEEPETALEK